MISFSVDPKSSIFKTLDRIGNMRMEALHKRLGRVAADQVRDRYFTFFGKELPEPYTIYQGLKRVMAPMATQVGVFTGSTKSAITGQGTEQSAQVILKGRWPLPETYTSKPIKIPIAAIMASYSYRGRSAEQSEEEEGENVQETIAREFGHMKMSVDISGEGVRFTWPEVVTEKTMLQNRLYPAEDFDTKEYRDHPSARGRSGTTDFMYIRDPWDVDVLFKIVERHVSMILGEAVAGPEIPAYEAFKPTGETWKHPRIAPSYGLGELERKVERVKVFAKKPKISKAEMKRIGIKKRGIGEILRKAGVPRGYFKRPLGMTKYQHEAIIGELAELTQKHGIEKAKEMMKRKYYKS